jgi:hypothetical protein
VKVGSRVECINELSPLYHKIGRMVGVTTEGRVLVQFPVLGPDWESSFDAHDLELAAPIVQFWEESPWLLRVTGKSAQ